MTSDKSVARRSYSTPFKTQVVGECRAPGASVAKVALSHGINANVVHSWCKLAREAAGVGVAQQLGFVPVQVTAAPVPTPVALPVPEQSHIEVELHRGPLTMKINWPAAGAGDFAAWTRELLR